MNKACFVLLIAMSPVSLFAGETMATPSTPPPTKCNFRVDKCETSVDTDPSYMRFKDGTLISGVDSSSATADPAYYQYDDFAFQDFATHTPCVCELISLVAKKLSNCPEVELTFCKDSGDITVHYIYSAGDCCDWTINIRDVKADDFVAVQTTDNYSNQLGQMERRKFHTASQQDSQDIQTAFAQICAINGWQKQTK